MAGAFLAADEGWLAAAGAVGEDGGRIRAEGSDARGHVAQRQAAGGLEAAALGDGEGRALLEAGAGRMVNESMGRFGEQMIEQERNGRGPKL